MEKIKALLICLAAMIGSYFLIIKSESTVLMFIGGLLGSFATFALLSIIITHLLNKK